MPIPLGPEQPEVTRLKPNPFPLPDALRWEESRRPDCNRQIPAARKSQTQPRGHRTTRTQHHALPPRCTPAPPAHVPPRSRVLQARWPSRATGTRARRSGPHLERATALRQARCRRRQVARWTKMLPGARRVEQGHPARCMTRHPAGGAKARQNAPDAWRLQEWREFPSGSQKIRCRRRGRGRGGLAS